MNNRQLLEMVRAGELSVDDALKKMPNSYGDIGDAKLDIGRKERTGFGEVVFCQSKTNEQILDIFRSILDTEGEVLGTRATEKQFDFIRDKLANVQYDSVSKILKIEKDDKELKGFVSVCCAGTSDIPVAEEAAQTAEFFGARVKRFYDIGVCGIHRVMSNINDIKKSNCVIAVAGMEGALPSVLGGLVSVPVIAVPTSVGYGASFGGVTALLSMLNSCANGISVVNIDNGYGAGYIATQINRIAKDNLNE